MLILAALFGVAAVLTIPPTVARLVDMVPLLPMPLAIARDERSG